MDTIFSRAREPMNSLTHFIGAVLSAAGTVLLTVAAVGESAMPVRSVVGAVVFGLSLVALYSASSIYHFVTVSSAALLRFRKLDHAMIFVLIAGTYTPLFLHYSPNRGVLLCGVIWGAALLGIGLKLVWMGMPRWLSTLFYVALGWAIVFDPAVLRVLPAGCGALLLAGGLAYTAGAVIYWLKKPNPSPRFGFHEIFHVFVLIGSALHFMAILFYAI